MAFRYKRPSIEYGNCLSCRVVLSDENWSKSQQKYHRFMCMPCYSERQKRYSSKQPVEHRRLLQAKYRARKRKDPPHLIEKERRRRYGNWLLRKYGMRIEDFDEMYLSQNGKCAICLTEKPRGRGGFHVDHCHNSGKVRALLCSECNMMIGLAKDNRDTLSKAISYLTFHATREDHKHEARIIAGGKQF